MQSAESEAHNITTSILIGVLGFLSDNWVQILILSYGAVHVYIALEKWMYEKKQRKGSQKNDK